MNFYFPYKYPLIFCLFLLLCDFCFLFLVLYYCIPVYRSRGNFSFSLLSIYSFCFLLLLYRFYFYTRYFINYLTSFSLLFFSLLLTVFSDCGMIFLSFLRIKKDYILLKKYLSNFIKENRKFLWQLL